MSRDFNKDRLCKLTREAFDNGGNLMRAVAATIAENPDLVAEFVTKNVFDTCEEGTA